GMIDRWNYEAGNWSDDNTGERMGIGMVCRILELGGVESVKNKLFRRGDDMEGWKKAVVAGSIGAATVLFMKKKYPAGVLATGVGLAVLASEYPEKFEMVRRSLPEYFDRGMQVMEMAAKAGQRITEAAGRSTVDAWEEIG